MQSIKKIGSLVLVLFITLVFSAPIISIAAEAPINLGTAKYFAILAGSTITNTGVTTINGNVGLSPGTSFTQESAVINGEIHINDNAALQAKIDLTNAFADLAGRTKMTLASQQLGGLTLTPGYYVYSSDLLLTGTLTLDAQNDPNAIFIIEAGTTLTSASNSNVILMNGAKSSQIYWNIGSSASLGTASHMEGTILAKMSITLTTSATINGSLLAQIGAVTLDTNTVGTLINLPVIAIDKTANKSQIYNSPEMVTYYYSISNPGVNNLKEVVVTDDKIGIVNYVSGDTNTNTFLEPNEVWLFSANTPISNTTTNIGTVTAKSNNVVVVATDLYTVTLYIEPVVTTQPTSIATTETSTETTEATTEATTETNTETTTQQGFEVPELVDSTIESTESTTSEPTETVTEVDTPPTSPVEPGGSLPQTATPLMLYLSSGAVLILLGIAGMKFIK